MYARNDVIRDGVHGIGLEVDGDEAGALRRLDLGRDPVRHRLYPVIHGSRGEVLLDGRWIQGVDPDVNRSTTIATRPISFDRHEFFIPYHRLDLPPGEHIVRVGLYLEPRDGRPAERVFEPLEVKVRMPSLDWVFTAVELRDPERIATGPIRWRARVGQDVVAVRDMTPAVVVLGAEDALYLDVWTHDRWTEIDASSLGEAANAIGLAARQVRVLEVRKSPPHLDAGSVQVTPTIRGGMDGWNLDMTWSLEGRSVDALLALDARAYVVDGAGERWPLPGVPVDNGPDQARLFVPAWAVPSFVQAGEHFRLGWDLVARAGKGSPLTRDVAFRGVEVDQVVPEVAAAPALTASVGKVEILSDEGLGLRAEVRWTLPEGLPGEGPERTPRVLAGWSGGPSVSGPWTRCVANAPACNEAWTLGPVTARDGATLVSLPLAPLALSPEAEASLTLRAVIDGYRGAEATLEVPLDLPPVRAVTVRPRKASLECSPGSTVQVVVEAGGLVLGSTSPVPCSTTLRWDVSDTLHLRAFEGDEVDVDLRVDGRTRRRDAIRIEPRRARADLAEPTAGIRSARVDVVIE